VYTDNDVQRRAGTHSEVTAGGTGSSSSSRLCRIQ